MFNRDLALIQDTIRLHPNKDLAETTDVRTENVGWVLTSQTEKAAEVSETKINDDIKLQSYKFTITQLETLYGPFTRKDEEHSRWKSIKGKDWSPFRQWAKFNLEPNHRENALYAQDL